MALSFQIRLLVSFKLQINWKIIQFQDEWRKAINIFVIYSCWMGSIYFNHALDSNLCSAYNFYTKGRYFLGRKLITFIGILKLSKSVFFSIIGY